MRANEDFYEQMFEMDSSGFEEAVKIAYKYDTMGGLDENDLRVAFYVRLALCLLHGDNEVYCRKALQKAVDISKSQTLRLIELLQCETECKEKMKEYIDKMA